MRANQNTNMQKFMNKTTSFYQFLRLGDVFLIVIPSWMCKQAIGMLLRPWNVLYVWFQFWKIWEKSAKCMVFLGATPESLWLGLGFCMYMEWFWSKIQAQQPCIQCFWDLISMVSFSISFMWRTCQLLEILSLWSVHEILRLLMDLLAAQKDLKTFV